MKSPLISMHVRDENGWFLVATERSDWGGWDKTDRSWINELLARGHDVITVGDTMYEYYRK
jgi:hypothetical protein